MNILEIIGALTLFVLVGIVIGHAMGWIKVSAERVKD